MSQEKRQKIYKVIMLLVIACTITFVLTTILVYKNLGETSKYIYVSANDKGISSTIASFRKIIDKKFLGEIDEDKLLEGAIKGYVAGLGDPYTEYMTKEEMEDFNVEVQGNFVGIGVYLTKDTVNNTIMVISPIKDTPAYEAGIKPGDIISKVDGVSYTGEQLTEATNKIKGEEGTKVKLEIMRQEEIIELEVERKSVKINHVESEMLESKIGYIKFNTFDEGCSEEFKTQLENLKKDGMKALIIDIRNNGGGLVSETLDIADYIVEKNKTLLITVDKDNEEEIEKAEEDPIVNVPIVVLTNENSASASEILAGALKDNGKATIVGTTTYGKGVIQELLTLNDGSGLKITTNEYFTPNRTKINKIGIKPDYEVKLPEELEDVIDIQKNEDTQLQKAIELLK